MLLAGMFVVPRIMEFLPNFDPLMIIILIFGLLAGAQHFGFVEQGHTSEAERLSSQRARQQKSWDDQDDTKKPDDPIETLLENAEQALGQNNYKRVQELAQKLLDLDPENTRAWEMLVLSLKFEGNRSEAAANAKKAFELYEVDSETLKKLRQELHGKCDVAAAATLAGENAQKGDDFVSKRQYDLAIDCYNRCIETLKPEGQEKVHEDFKELYLKSIRNRAVCAQQLQDWGTCRRDATVLLEIDPNDKQALMQRAASNEALEKFAAALEDARKLLSLDPKNTAANRMVHNCQKAINS